MSNKLYVINKDNKTNVLNDIINDIIDKKELLIIKDDVDGEILSLISNKINQNELMIIDNTKDKNNFLLDISHILLKDKTKVVYFKETFTENKNLFTDIKIYMTELEKKKDNDNIKILNILINNYKEKNDMLNSIVSNCRRFKINIDYIVDNKEDLNDVLKSNFV